MKATLLKRLAAAEHNNNNNNASQVEGSRGANSKTSVSLSAFPPLMQTQTFTKAQSALLGAAENLEASQQLSTDKVLASNRRLSLSLLNDVKTADGNISSGGTPKLLPPSRLRGTSPPKTTAVAQQHHRRISGAAGGSRAVTPSTPSKRKGGAVQALQANNPYEYLSISLPWLKHREPVFVHPNFYLIVLAASDKIMGRSPRQHSTSGINIADATDLADTALTVIQCQPHTAPQFNYEQPSLLSIAQLQSSHRRSSSAIEEDILQYLLLDRRSSCLHLSKDYEEHLTQLKLRQDASAASWMYVIQVLKHVGLRLLHPKYYQLASGGGGGGPGLASVLAQSFGSAADRQQMSFLQQTNAFGDSINRLTMGGDSPGTRPPSATSVAFAQPVTTDPLIAELHFHADQSAILSADMNFYRTWAESTNVDRRSRWLGAAEAISKLIWPAHSICHSARSTSSPSSSAESYERLLRHVLNSAFDLGTHPILQKVFAPNATIAAIPTTASGGATPAMLLAARAFKDGTAREDEDGATIDLISILLDSAGSGANQAGVPTDSTGSTQEPRPASASSSPSKNPLPLHRAIVVASMALSVLKSSLEAPSSTSGVTELITQLLSEGLGLCVWDVIPDRSREPPNTLAELMSFSPSLTTKFAVESENAPRIALHPCFSGLAKVIFTQTPNMLAPKPNSLSLQSHRSKVVTTLLVSQLWSFAGPSVPRLIRHYHPAVSLAELAVTMPTESGDWQHRLRGRLLVLLLNAMRKERPSAFLTVTAQAFSGHFVDDHLAWLTSDFLGTSNAARHTNAEPSKYGVETLMAILECCPSTAPSYDKKIGRAVRSAKPSASDGQHRSIGEMLAFDI
eukprot:GILI01007290.1.p1 GENE.GILI01007290.1~~GILI01007290.1.p1  ORF type:complete len:888 (-),score=131.19 GILI01007290.1:83-2644(-)